ncbi:four helix bundle protein [Desertivirga arenae]|uniref:four helix bundle protein n=1 Tax=Desertivirga arenae TaxID=2810309 RepID=UPI001A975595|nr:four helix bundle protein [Pedobacter sp. SYSU D00823]
MNEPDKVEFIEKFKRRTKKFVIDNILLFKNLPKSDEARILGKQLLRCSSSVGANYRAACRGRSQAEFFSKISIVVEEADETLFWMEVMVESGIVSEICMKPLMEEARQILAVVAKARKSASENIKRRDH